MSESTYKKAYRGRAHKERSQPAHRSKLGALEKHKDYVLRARDFHKKEKALQILREKAEFRNEDEFYFGMQRAETKGGVHQARGVDPSRFSQEQLMLMKTQDQKYVEMKAHVERKRIDKLKASLHHIDDAPLGKRTVFVIDGEDATTSSAGRGAEGAPSHAPPAPRVRGIAKRKAKAYKELERCEARHGEIARIAQRMAAEKVGMGKGRKRRIAKASQNGGVPIYKFKRVRQR